MSKFLLHFDTANSNYDASTNDPMNTNFTITNPKRQIRSISLKSLELPISFTNIRSGSMSQFGIVISGTTYSITLNNKVYTSVSALLTDINNAFSGLTLPNSGVLTLSNVGNFLLCTLACSAPTIFSIVSTQMSYYVLGLKNTGTLITSGNNTSILGNNNILLNVDNYIIMYFPSIPTSTMTSTNGSLCHFKIPLNATNGVVFYEGDNATFKQSVEITDSNYIFLNLKVQFFDRFGNSLINGLDYSFTLEIDTY